MPEGDTIFRTATNVRAWLVGREVTAARCVLAGVPLERTVGTKVDAVEARAKHLLLRFSNGLTLRTHMRMTGSWHLYARGTRWKKPAWQARIVLECGDRVAVCFNAPDIQLLRTVEEATHPVLSGLGPDVLTEGFDLDEVLRRAAATDPKVLVGELLLDQRVVSGFGNIYRCEALFLCRTDPWTTVGDLPDGRLAELVVTGRDLIAANAGPGAPTTRSFGAGLDVTWVYGRTGRPCRRCGQAVRSERLGTQARMAHWCPRCQGPGPPAP